MVRSAGSSPVSRICWSLTTPLCHQSSFPARESTMSRLRPIALPTSRTALRPAIGDDHAGHGGTIAAIFVVEILQNLLPPFVLEIDVDIGRLAACGTDETLEQHIDPIRIDGGDAQAITDGAVGRRSAPLAQNSPRAGEDDDVIYSQKIVLKTKLLDEGQFVFDQSADFVRNAVGITSRGAGPGQLAKILQRGFARWREFIGIFIAQFVQLERASLGNFHSPADGAGIIGEKPMHLLGRFEIALGVWKKAKARLANGAAVANAGHYILQHPAGGVVIINIVGRKKGNVEMAREIVDLGKPGGVVGTVGAACGKGETIFEGVF